MYVKPLQRSIGGKYPAESRETGPRRSLLIYPPGGLGYHTAVEIMFCQAPLARGFVPLCHSEPVLTLAWESVPLCHSEPVTDVTGVGIRSQNFLFPTYAIPVTLSRALTA